MIVVNFKTYREATGYKAVELAQICKKIGDETGVRIVAVPQLVDLKECVTTGVECWVQNIDPVGQGKYTGWTAREVVEEAGAVGSLVNHSEHKMSWEGLEWILKEIAGTAFQTCVAAADVAEAQKIAPLKPNYILYEPPELVGSADKSVSSEKPEVVSQVVAACPGVPVLVGAGVKSAADVQTAKKLGAAGVGLASNLVLAASPEMVLKELARAWS